MSDDQQMEPPERPCPSCNGSGYKDTIVQTDQGPQPVSSPCGNCVNGRV